MSSNESDEPISLSTIRILAGSVESSERPPSSSQVSSCCSSFACTADARVLRVLPESGCFRDPSESRLQLVVTVFCILRSYRAEHAITRESVRSVRWDTDRLQRLRGEAR